MAPRRLVAMAAGLAAVLLAGAETRAQVVVETGATYAADYGVAPLVGAPALATTYSSAYVAPASSVLPGGTYQPPYSYYAAPLGLPPRIYVGYGATDIFPFHGDPYGYPYDRWTWAGMGNYPYSLLARYYYPPVP